VTPLEAELRERIARDGPVTVAEFMALALYHPEHGYYMKGQPVGAAGAFITAPEISQVFGELLGLWAAAQWRAMGAPDMVHLVELGPGRGTLMADALRAVSQAMPGFAGALSLHLVETSPVLKAEQKAALGHHAPAWHDDIATVPDGPMLLLANEFLDALPIQQFVREKGALAERVVAVDDRGALAFAASGRSLPFPEDDPDRDSFAIMEANPAANGWVSRVARRLAEQGGAALFIDYGYTAPQTGSTLQAVRDHRKADPLQDPGEADLTALVNFPEIAFVAGQEGAQVYGPHAQGELLRRLGIEARRDMLLAAAAAQQAEDIRSGIARLIDPDQMGTLFQALAVTGPNDPPPPGFETDAP
jgi:NADH dehydrogenase [ubiquinone] 1 alpha subcomplex assembly factor 7